VPVVNESFSFGKSCRRFGVPFAMVLAFAIAAWTAPAFAQSGTGAERYEVTITPPKRPGTEAAVDEAATPGASATPQAARDAANPDEVLGAGEAAGDAPASPPAAAATAPAVTRPEPTPETVRAEKNLPLRTLQVGAYRQHKSAVTMRDKLAATFQDVAIVEVQSGGEPLYRVNVGRLPRGAGLDDLRRRLVAAGHPAFDVTAPSVPASD